MHYLFLAITFLILVTALVSIPVFAQDLNQPVQQPQSQGVTQRGQDSEKGTTHLPQTSEERAYTEQMIQLSNAILQKISEIQAKQKAIEAEIYPAFIGNLQAEKTMLQNQLNDLQMRKSQIESQKTVNDMTKQLNPSTQNTLTPQYP